MWVVVGEPKANGRSPQGERGLKFFYVSHLESAKMSLPARGAWIEIVRIYERGK